MLTTICRRRLVPNYVCSYTSLGPLFGRTLLTRNLLRSSSSASSAEHSDGHDGRVSTASVPDLNSTGDVGAKPAAAPRQVRLSSDKAARDFLRAALEPKSRGRKRPIKRRRNSRSVSKAPHPVPSLPAAGAEEDSTIQPTVEIIRGHATPQEEPSIVEASADSNVVSEHGHEAHASELSKSTEIIGSKEATSSYDSKAAKPPRKRSRGKTVKEELELLASKSATESHAHAGDAEGVEATSPVTDVKRRGIGETAPKGASKSAERHTKDLLAMRSKGKPPAEVRKFLLAARKAPSEVWASKTGLSTVRPLSTPMQDLEDVVQDIATVTGKRIAKSFLQELLSGGGLTKKGQRLVTDQLREQLVLPVPRKVAEAVQLAAEQNQLTQPQALPTSGNSKSSTESSETSPERGQAIRSHRSATTSRSSTSETSSGRGPTIRSLKSATTSRGTAKYDVKTIHASDLELKPVENPGQPPVPALSYGLDRALFNPGPYHLRDPRSRVFNFDPYLATIMPAREFDYNALKEYITSSRDEVLISTAAAHKKKYTGSTSSMTAALAHFHYLLSSWRPLSFGTLSQGFGHAETEASAIQRAPSAIFLRWRDGTYAIDADKEFDQANILMMLGKSLEKLLTLDKEDYERYRVENSHQISEEERNESEAYHYSTHGDFLLRSQLDAHDPRLPGTGMFDLKTRAVASIRMDVQHYEKGVGYEIMGRFGRYESYEREFYEMIRNAFLKYSLQVRMGRMDGIFVAFHNIERIFGFQYISIAEMDQAIHGTPDEATGDSEFKLSLELLNEVLNKASAKFPEQSLRIHIETRKKIGGPYMYIFAEPVSEEQIKSIQSTNAAKIQEFERRVLGLHQPEAWDTLQAKVEESILDDDLGIVDENEDLDAGLLMNDADGERHIVEGQIEGYAEPIGFQATGVDGSSDEEELEDKDDENDGNEEHDVLDEEDHDESEDDDESEEHDESEDNIEEEKERGAGAEGKEESLEGQVKEAETQMTAEELKHDALDGGILSQSATDHTHNLPIATFGQTNFADVKTEHAAPEREGNEQSKEAVEDEANNDADTEADFLPTESQHPAAAQTSDHLESSDDTEGDLLAMSLVIRNKVNGRYVERTDNLTAKDKWTVEYALSEIKDPGSARSLYKRILDRRARTLSGFEGVRSANSERMQQYVARIDEITDKHKAWRRLENERDLTEPIRVWEPSSDT